MKATFTISFDYEDSIAQVNEDRKAEGEPPMDENEIEDYITEDIQSYLSRGVGPNEGKITIDTAAT